MDHDAIWIVQWQSMKWEFCSSRLIWHGNHIQWPGVFWLLSKKLIQHVMYLLPRLHSRCSKIVAICCSHHWAVLEDAHYSLGNKQNKGPQNGFYSINCSPLLHGEQHFHTMHELATQFKCGSIPYYVLSFWIMFYNPLSKRIGEFTTNFINGWCASLTFGLQTMDNFREGDHAWF